MENNKPVKELELYIIRHGQSMGNVGYDKDEITLKEANDPYLTDLGIEQAQKAGESLSDIHFDAVYSSALLRAVRTAAEIINKQPRPVALNIHPCLTEIGVSKEYTGADAEEIAEIFRDFSLDDSVTADSPILSYNNNEDEEELFERAEKVIKSIRDKYNNGEKVAVVCHAGFMTYLVFSIMGFQKSVPVFDVNFNNTSVTKSIFYKEGTNKYGDIVFEYINSIRHLTDKY